MKVAKTYWYKVVVMLVSIATTSIVLNEFAKLINHFLKINYNTAFEFCMVIGMLIFQFLFIYKKHWQLQLNYYYSVLVVSLFGSIMLIPLLIANQFFILIDAVNIIYFFCVVVIMFLIHKHKVTQLQLPFYLSYTWVLYRLFILIFILY